MLNHVIRPLALFLVTWTVCAPAHAARRPQRPKSAVCKRALDPNDVLGLRGVGPSGAPHVLELRSQGGAALIAFAGWSSFNRAIGKVALPRAVHKLLIAGDVPGLDGVEVFDADTATTMNFKIDGVDEAGRPRLEVRVATATEVVLITACVVRRRSDAPHS